MRSVADSLTPKQKSAITRVVKHPELQFFLFNKADGLAWIDGFREAGFLNPEFIERPKPVGDGTFQIPSWPITEYLVRNSKHLREPDNARYASEVWQFICDVTNYAKSNDFGNYRVWWQFSKVLRNIPLEILEDSYLEILEFWLSDNFDRGLLGDQIVNWCQDLMQGKNELSLKIAFSLFALIFKIERVDKKWGGDDNKEAVLSFQSYRIREHLVPLAKMAGETYGQSATSFFIDKMGEVLDIDQTDRLSTTWRRAIEDHEQNHANEGADHLLVECLRENLAASFSSSSNETANTTIGDLLRSRFETIRRIAIYTANSNFEKISDDILDELIKKPFFCETYRHELWHFFNRNYLSFRANLKEKIVNIISEDSESRDDRRTAIYQARWLSSIKDSDKRAHQLYDKCVKLIGFKPDQPDFSSYITGGVVVHESPLEVEDLFSMSSDLKKMTSYLNDYTYQGGAFNEPGLEGLVKVFGSFILARPEFVLSNLGEFQSLKPHYLHELFDAFLNAWNGESVIEWESAWLKILEFSISLFSNQEFWLYSEEQPGAAFIGNSHWVVGTFSRLIEAGCKKDGHNFSIDVVPLAKQVLETILEFQSGEQFEDGSDAVSIAINSPRGRCLEAYINLSLFHLRNSTKGDRDRILESYLSTYESELGKADEEYPEFEFATLIANYYPNFLFNISEEWTTKNVTRIFNWNNRKRWLCAVQGYSYVGQFIPKVYDFFKSQGFFFKILDCETLHERVGKRYIKTIAVAYLQKRESIDDPENLIVQLIQRGGDREIGQLIWFIWTLRDGEAKDRAKEIVYELFPVVLKAVDLDSKEGKHLASHLCHWAIYLNDLDEQSKQWLLTIAPYANEDHNTNYLLDGLAEISESNPFDASDIWAEMLRIYAYDYPEDKIKRIFRNLVSRGNAGIYKAREIASQYLQHQLIRPNEWLNEIIQEADNI